MYYEYVLIKGAGDLASGVACTLHRAGYRIILTEIEQPTCVRRKVSFAEAVYNERITIEGVTGQRVSTWENAQKLIKSGQIAVIVDPRQEIKQKFVPAVFLEATLAKRNNGTSKNDGEIVIALGPGFEAGTDVHAVIETQKGETLGSVIYSGYAIADTGIPGDVLGYTSERVLRAPAAGEFRSILDIGDFVDANDIIGFVGNCPVRANIGGVVRGLLHSGLMVHKGMKIGDIFPQKNKAVCTLVSDKAWTVGKGVLQAIEELEPSLLPTF